ncbi:MAG TPA: hypothetical protein VF573_00840 [Paraburkholderia sp.]|uniref:hypothetical protein n=1 Tax=Paraburkholderia sp. TaxID=1926495 RepID=UPI002ED08271
MARRGRRPRRADGKISATNADGSGGTVDTQAAQLAFGKHAAVYAGRWNLSTPEFTIDDAAARALQRSLNAGTSVNVSTTGATGDLGVASNLTRQGPASLTLAAYHNVSVTSGTTIANTGAGNLTLRADASGIDNGGGVINNGTIDWSASRGIVSALYDMTSTYEPGTNLSNSGWTATPDSGLVTQITYYLLVNSLDDPNKVTAVGNYALGKDIDATPPSGAFDSPIGGPLGGPLGGPFGSPFFGQFDGMGHTISHVNLSSASGLFPTIAFGGVVRNLTVEGSVSTADYAVDAGILAGLNEGTIAAVHTSGSIASTGLYGATGGLVGLNSGTITRSSSTADVSSRGSAGGLVGTNGFGVLRQSFSSGDVTSTGPNIGGLVGYNFGLLTQSYATGAVHVPPQCDTVNACGGGLAGTNSGTISQSFATGRIDQPSGPAGGPGGVVDLNINYVPPPATITDDVYWNIETTGATVGVRSTAFGALPGGAQGLTTVQMSTPSSFGPTYDFGPGGVWAMPAGAAHPVLQWQLAQ